MHCKSQQRQLLTCATMMARYAAPRALPLMIPLALRSARSNMRTKAVSLPQGSRVRPQVRAIITQLATLSSGAARRESRG
ncbi:hypothetical protein PYCCODRAFT_725570 [Trametes coccinea BRFM310]|uniref:Uncharacterized protein n=1 Tax=Trametes coccinea (strain BRFM310) TaxID=1353009 RepID=A0A1Y2IID3_TRAC3|nr:hypothetical protein PYCCODRAFT_725570 [Trametes coccinea BRFM310]